MLTTKFKFFCIISCDCLSFRFSAAVASFAMLLRNSKYQGNATFEGVEDLTRTAKGEDLDGYHNEFLRLVELGKTFTIEENMKLGIR